MVHEPEKHSSLSGTAAVLHNAQHLVAVIEPSPASLAAPIISSMILYLLVKLAIVV